MTEERTHGVGWPGSGEMTISLMLKMSVALIRALGSNI
jgi:hypothetical protein